MQAALAGGKAKKKKWNKGKMREKINAKVLFDEDGWNRLQAEVPKVQTTSDDGNVAYIVIKGLIQASHIHVYHLSVSFVLCISSLLSSFHVISSYFTPPMI